MNISEIVKPENTFFNMSFSGKEQVLRFLANAAQKSEIVSDSDGFFRAIMYRESLSETGLVNGIAIPHGESNVVKTPEILYLQLSDPIEWESIDGQKIKHVFLMAIPERRDAENNIHIKMLSELARALMKTETVTALNSVQNASQLIDLLQGR